MKLLRTTIVLAAFFCIVAYLPSKSYAQAPSISYTPSTYTMTQNTAISPMTPNNGGGMVASFSYGTGAGITGGSLDHP
ncbi:MAG TPA: hypothetical protein VHC47_09420, partial [Mucilaginibacter sp.]|nr:hypothetical protein [Mucilaginibacter sp.]